MTDIYIKLKSLSEQHPRSFSEQNCDQAPLRFPVY